MDSLFLGTENLNSRQTSEKKVKINHLKKELMLSISQKMENLTDTMNENSKAFITSEIER